MRDNTRKRIDYTPGPAAVRAIEAAFKANPRLNKQAVIDRLVIVGWCAEHQPRPTLHGSDRDRWRLPAELAQPDGTGT